MKRKVLLVICMCMCLLCGCSSRGSFEHEDLNLERVLENSVEEIEAQGWKLGTLNEDCMDEETLSSQYGLSSADVKEYCVRQAIIPASCGEIAIFHILDDDASKVETAVQHRVETLAKSMEALPKQKACVEQYQTIQIGRYYLFVLGEDAQNVIQYISSL